MGGGALFKIISRLVLPALLIVGGRQMAFADPAFDKQHADLLRDKSLQFAFDQPAPPPPPPGWAKGLLEALSAIAPLFGWLMWIGLALLVVMLAYFIGREVWAARPARREVAARGPAIQTTDVLAPERARVLLEEADRLAALGQYEQAARTLLHRSIEDIHDKRPNLVRRSWTARDIEASALPNSLRSAFSHIARAVERSWFGGRTLGQSDWQTCRAAYEPFASREAWQS